MSLFFAFDHIYVSSLPSSIAEFDVARVTSAPSLVAPPVQTDGKHRTDSKPLTVGELLRVGRLGTEGKPLTIEKQGNLRLAGGGGVSRYPSVRGTVRRARFAGCGAHDQPDAELTIGRWVTRGKLGGC